MDVAMSGSLKDEFEAAVAESCETLGIDPPVEDPAAALPVLAPAMPSQASAMLPKDDDPPLVSAAKRMLNTVGVYRAFGGSQGARFEDRCILCEMSGIHTPTSFRCNCACHQLRAALGAL